MKVEVVDTEVVMDDLLQFLGELSNLPEELLDGIAAETDRSLEEVRELLRATETLVSGSNFLIQMKRR